MSQFDFPRINFFGDALVNAASANNNSLLPLVIFNPIINKAIIPPRIYISKLLEKLNTLGFIQIPKESPLLIDEEGLTYFEIKAINTSQLFKQWITIPLGNCPFDEGYHLIYDKIRTTKDNLPLKGSIPAGWNYFGGMDFEFSNVKISNIELSDDNSNSIFYSIEDKECPSDIAQILEASITFKNSKGKNTAVMVDIIPTLPLYTQVFCDSFVVTKDEKALLEGKPNKASLRFLNKNRIVNQEGAIGSSGTFFCVISLEQLKKSKNDVILSFLRKHEKRSIPISGIFVRYNIFEVEQNQAPNYKELNTQSNPALCKVLGSITPWYKTDLKSITMGRQMIPENPFYDEKTLPPFVFIFDEKRKVIALDLINSIPEIAAKVDLIQQYETYNLGCLKFIVRTKGGAEIEIGDLDVNEENLSRNKFIKAGGILEILYSSNEQIQEDIIKTGEILIYGNLQGSLQMNEKLVLLMRESEYMIASDQTGIYINQNDAPENGFTSNSIIKEACRITIYHKGLPIQEGIQMTILELRLSSIFKQSINLFLETKDFKNNQTINFSTHEPANVIYVFYPDNSYKPTKSLIPYILATGFFINLRVLPQHNFGKYLDPTNPEFPTPVTFNILYEEILKVYDLIYPSSSTITPFTEDYFKRGWKFIKQRLAPDNWNSFSYMPTSRDISEDQWLLFCKWVDSHQV